MRNMMYLYDGWQFALQRQNPADNWKEARNLSFSPVTLPHDWAISCPLKKDTERPLEQGFFDRWGTGWYQRELFLNKEMDRKYLLCFDGVYENSTVWVNDQMVGRNKYGYSGFSFDVTDALHDGTNELWVKVDNTQTPADRWYSGAGIYRKVYLMMLDAVHLDAEEVRIKTSFEGTDARLCIYTGMKTKVSAVLSSDNCIYSADSEMEDCGEEMQEVVRMRVPKYMPWSAQKPQLYKLVLRLLENGDEIVMQIGFREVNLSAQNGLLINGEKVKLKGVCLHQDVGCFGIAVTKELIRSRLEELKKIGCNALRLAHHLYMPEVLELCDEMGFYVYEECFDKWTGGAYGRYYETEWEKDLVCMVKRDRNRPSILFWGVGNEVENQAHDSMLKLLEKHVKKVKEHDASRLVSVAMNPHFGYPDKPVDMKKVEDIQQFVDEMKTGEIFDIYERIERIRLIAQKVDFLSCNYQEQWYDAIHEVIPDKAILGTETYMYFRGQGEKFQNFSEEIPWFDVEKRDYCIGAMIWTGIDYLGESMGYPAKGWSGALFAADMEKRPIAWQYQSYWTKEPMIQFAVADYSLPDEGAKEHWSCPPYVTHWDFPQFSNMPVPYMIATNCEEVELSVNEKVFLIKSVAEYPNHVIKGYLPYLPGTVTVIGKNNEKEVCRQVVRTPGKAVKLLFEEAEKTVELASTGEGFVCYQLFLKVRAFDAENNPGFHESAKVRFLVEGPAELVGVENGDMKSWEPCRNNFVHLYRGRANAALRITGEGRVCVTAYAAGMQSARCTVVVRKVL